MTMTVHIINGTEPYNLINITTVETDDELDRLAIMAGELNCYLEVTE